MQSAPKGLGHLASGIRSLHVYAHPPRPGVGAHPHPPRPPTVTGRLLQTTRTAFTRFFAHITTPGFTHPVARGGARGLSTRVAATVRPQTIQQGLSLPARYALSRPTAGTLYCPRASPVSRSTVHVGLGTARNFSTARPLFQQFVQNVPVAGRAIYEADWDLEKRKMKDKVRRNLKATTAEEKENLSLMSGIRTKPIEKTKKVTELERYFPSADSTAAGVTTVLLVPLAPTPTSRFPLTETWSAEPNLLVVSDLQDVLSSHRVHSLRVSSLFARLDACGVWERGAAFTAHGDVSGLCTVLRVEFKGWTKGMVKDVMGDAGKGWCQIFEVKDDEEGGNASARSTPPEVDPAASVMLPTLDFSASFHAAQASVDSSGPPSPPLSTPSSPMLSVSELSYSPSSDFDMDMDMSMNMGMGMDMNTFESDSGSVISFSSDFAVRSARTSDDYEILV